MSKIRIGVIGAGGASGAHLGMMAEHDCFEVAAIADVVEAPAKERAERFGIERWTTDRQDIIDDESIEAVLITTPPVAHAEIAIEALRAGKHVFCEKPLAKTTDECRRILDVVHETGLVFVLGYPMRHSPEAQNLRQQIQSGRIGRPVWYRDMWAVNRGSPARSIHDAQLGGGVVYECSHWFDFVLWTFGPVKRVYAHTARFKPDDTTADDTAFVHIEFVSGDSAFWSESWSAPGFGFKPICVARHGRSHLDVIGPGGSMHFPDADGKFVLCCYENKDRGVPHGEPINPTEQWPWKNDWGANMVVTFPAEHRNFYDCIRSGAAPQCRAEDGAAVIELIEAILESNRTGTSVNLV